MKGQKTWLHICLSHVIPSKSQYSWWLWTNSIEFAHNHTKTGTSVSSGLVPSGDCPVMSFPALAPFPAREPPGLHHRLAKHYYSTETEMSSFWWNLHHWLHWKLSKWQLPVQPVIKISSKLRHFRFSNKSQQMFTAGAPHYQTKQSAYRNLFKANFRLNVYFTAKYKQFSPYIWCRIHFNVISRGSNSSAS